MSHIVTIQTKVKDQFAVAAACQRLALAAPVHGKAHLFEGEVTGLIVRLPGWEYPVVIDTDSGSVRFDDFGGRWGDQAQLDQFFQMYSVEKAKLEARQKGYSVTEQQLQDGSIRLQIAGGA